MRRLLMGMILLVMGTLLAGCGGSEPQSIPTLAQLPTVTRTPIPPTATPTPSPTEEIFFTPTPVDDVADSGFATPTPIVADGGKSPIESGACSPEALTAALDEVDLTALAADQEAFMARLRAAAGTVDGWTLAADPDPLAGTSTSDSLPLSSLRYNRGDNQEAFLLVSTVPDALRDLFTGCIADEAYFRQGDVSAAATIAIAPLSIGDRASLATITEPVGGETGDAGAGTLTTEVFSVLVGETLLQYINIPALDEAAGQTPVEQADAEALLNALTGIVRGL